MPNLGTFITWVLNSFGHRKAMIDCFEISTEKPFSVKVCVKMSSTYKHSGSKTLHQVPPQKIFGCPRTTIMTNIKMQ